MHVVVNLLDLVHQHAARDTRDTLAHDDGLNRSVARHHGARAALLTCLDAELLHHGIGRDARRRKLDAHAAGRQVGTLAGDIARAVEHDHGLVAALGKGGDVVDEGGARHIVNVTGIRIVGMVVYELFVARRAVDHVVTVDHQQLGLVGVHR